MNIDTEGAVVSKKAKTTHPIVDMTMSDIIEDSSMQMSRNTSSHKKNQENQDLQQADNISIQVKSYENLTIDNARQIAHMRQVDKKKISNKDDKMETESSSTTKDHDTNLVGPNNMPSLSHIKFSHGNPYLNKEASTNTYGKNQKNQCLKQANSIITEGTNYESLTIDNVQQTFNMRRDNENDVNNQENKMDTESISTIEDEEMKDEPKKKTYSEILKANETKQKAKEERQCSMTD
ncbi:7803_t:CDS:2 [Gigaspora margarita]|uniref:7803_t:CDS:1 n=1 Tax=Gigaspora margarita TaxID=4874 RepID=A0ABN7UAR9_GIGMA|nr:7803_t:CDS:2 [Gigaspora margarita]